MSVYRRATRFAETVRDDFARWQKIIRETGARAE